MIGTNNNSVSISISEVYDIFYSDYSNVQNNLEYENKFH